MTALAYIADSLSDDCWSTMAEKFAFIEILVVVGFGSFGESNLTELLAG